MTTIELSKRQEHIVEIVKKEGPITGEQIAEKLNLTRATLRPDLAILTMAGLLDARPRVGYFYSGKSPNAILAERINKISVDEIKSIPIVIRDDTTVYDAVVKMFLEDVGSLIVVSEGGFLEGVVSRKDLLKAALGSGDLNKLPISVVMTRMPNVATVTIEESAFMAAKKLSLRKVDALPVVREITVDDGEIRYEVIGRITKTNITRLFVELGEGR